MNVFAILPTATALVLSVAPLLAAPARGPLRVHPDNPRYFTDGARQPDGSLKAVYLTGSHTWANLIDRGPGDPPPSFDFEQYLDFLDKHRHNFIRLWARHVTWYHNYGEGELRAAPLAWSRTGHGAALDGKPKFDLTKFDDAYFTRLRTRVLAAAERGIYVSVMLFGGSYECRGGWRGNPFHALNNINSIDGDPDADGEGLETHTLQLPAITRLQQAYVRKVIDTVNDLDNIVYEISNEGHVSSKEWQYRLIDFIRHYQSTKPKQHPVGMTALYIDDPRENQRILAASPAGWISPLTDARGVRDIFVGDGSKVSLLDSDHWFVVQLYNDPAFGREWVWKSFCRGHNPILMEHLPPPSFIQSDHPLTTDDPGYIASRTAMGATRQFAERIRLSAMIPRSDLASTRYCLADPGKEYLIYQPKPREPFFVELLKAEYRYEWFDPAKARVTDTGTISISNARHRFEPPFSADAVLYLRAK